MVENIFHEDEYDWLFDGDLDHIKLSGRTKKQRKTINRQKAKHLEEGKSPERNGKSPKRQRRDPEKKNRERQSRRILKQKGT